MEGKATSNVQRLCFTEWLGIPSEECPPNYYRLLAIDVFESDRARIDQAVEGRLREIQTHRNGPHAKTAEALASQVVRVRSILLDAAGKARYDATLRNKLAEAAQAGRGVPAVAEGAVQGRSAPPTIPRPRERPPQTSSEPTGEPAPAPGGAKPAAVWYWVAGGLTINGLALVGILAFLLLRSPATPRVAENAPSPSPSTSVGQPPDAASESGANTVSEPAEAATANENESATSESVTGSSGGGSEKQPQNAGEPANTDEKPAAAATPQPQGASADKPDSDQPPSGPPPKADKPFKALASAFSLPERPDGVGKAGDPGAIPGYLPEAALDHVQMTMDSSLCDLEGRRFELAPIVLGGKKSRSWGIRFAEGDAQPAAAFDDAAGVEYVALVSITNQRQIGFQWSDGASRARAEQLCNAVLQLSYENERHAVAFRQPQSGAPMRLDLADGSIEVPIEIDTPPVRERMYCEVLSLDNLTSGESKPILESEAKTLPLDDKKWGRITIPPHLAFDLSFAGKESKEESELQLQLKSRYNKEGKTWVPFKDKDLKATLQRLQRDIGANLRDLNAHVANYQASMTALPQVQADAKAAMTGKVNPAQATAANNRLQSVMKAIRASENGIKRLSGSLPRSYEALGRLYELAVLSEQLKRAGQIQFHVVAQAEVAPVVLAAFKAEPPQLEGPIVLDGFSMNPAGTWLQMRGGLLVYELAGAGGCTIMNPFQGKPVPGQWSEQNLRVLVEARNVRDEYEMVSPFQLRGVNVSLYRVPQ